MTLRNIAAAPDLGDIIRAVKEAPRHEVLEFELPRTGLFKRLNRLVESLDDIAEFIYLGAGERSFTLKIRHR